MTTSQIITEYSKRAAGVYRMFIDATAESNYTAQQNVVVVGQFEQGPVMRAIKVKNPTELHQIFGNRSVRLEAKGCFGNIVAEHLLEQGPICILNVKNINALTETVQSRQLAVNASEVNAIVNEPINTVFDTTKFWKVDNMYAATGTDYPTMSLVAVGEGKVTVVIEKIELDDYNYTVAETKQYNESFIGEGLNDDDFVNDYMVKMHVFQTDLASAKLSVANAFINGQLNLAVLDQIKADNASKFFATYTGTIGDVIDLNGNNLNICTAINNDTDASGLHIALNRDAIAIKPVDLLGTGNIVFTGDALPTATDASRLGYAFTPVLTPLCIYSVDTDRNQAYYFGNNSLQVGDVLANEDGYVRLVNKQYVDDKYALASANIGTVTAPVMPNGQPFPKSATGTPVYPSTSPNAGQAIQLQGDNPLWFYKQYNEVNAKWHVQLVSLPAEGQVELVVVYNLNGAAGNASAVATSKSKSDIESAMASIVAAIQADTNITVVATVSDAVENVDIDIVMETTVLPNDLAAFSLTAFTYNSTGATITDVEGAPTIASKLYVTASAPITVNGEHTIVTCNGTSSNIDINAVTTMYGQSTPVYLLQFSAPLASVLTSGLPITPNYTGAWGASQTETINGNQVAMTPFCVVKMERWNAAVSTYGIQAIHGIVSLESHYVNGTAARQNAVLDRLNDNGIMTSFFDPTIFRCRYMVDSFKTYIEPNAKMQFAKLAGNADRFPVLTPGPFYYELRNSKNPDFHNVLGEFDMAYVAKGQNPDKPSTNSFYFARSTEYSKFLWPFMNVLYNDGFSTKPVPSVGAVGKLFYSKLTGTGKVYDIVAGQDWPVAAKGVVGPEFDSGPDDRAAMERMGLNVLQNIDVNGQTVLEIRSSKTAFQTINSAFNYPETLEKCFYVSDEVEPTLDGKLFKFNSPEARLAVKKKADSVCDLLVADGAIESYENICDLSNNPIEVRKAGILILDTVMYNAYGIRIALHRTTIKDPDK